MALAQTAADDPDAFEGFFGEIGRVPDRLEAFPKPTIGALTVRRVKP